MARRPQARDRAADARIGLGELRVGKPRRPWDVLRASALDEVQALNVVTVDPALLLTFAGEDTCVIAPRMTAGVAERRSAATRASSALMSRKMLLGWPERAADPALGLHAEGPLYSDYELWVTKHDLVDIGKER